jgi:hypothetical protein
MKSIAVIGLRLLAIYVIIKMLELGQFIVPYFMYEQGESIEAISLAILILIHWFIFGGLFFGAERISRFMLPKQLDEEIEVTDYERITAILFSTVGLLVFFWGIEMLFNAYSNIINLNVMQPDFLRDNKGYLFWIPFSKGGVQIISGLLLFIGGKKLAKWWIDFRNWT